MDDKITVSEPTGQDAPEIQNTRLKEEIRWYVEQRNALIELVEAQQKYIAVLTDELDSLVGMAAVHGWRSNNVEKGAECRKEIDQIKEKLNL